MKIAYFTDTYSPEVNGVASTLEKLSDYLGQKEIRHVFFAPDYDAATAYHLPNGNPITNALATFADWEAKRSMPAHVARTIKTQSFSETKSIHRFPGIKVGVSPNSCLSFPKTRQIFELCDKFAPDLVHVTTELGIGYKGMKYALSRKLPLIMSYHTDFCKYLDYFGLGLFEPFVEMHLKRFHSCSNRTLVPSMYTMKQLLQKGYNNLGIWSRGIDTGNFNSGFRNEHIRNRLGIGDKFAFLYVGRLSPEKGLHMLHSAIDKINRIFPGKTAFVFTGDGPYAEAIRQIGHDNVIMTGFNRGRELSEIYASCDLFAFPSGTETFGNTCLEAMASGLPIVGVNNGGVTDYLIHGENGLLSSDGDQDGFTANLIKLMNNPQLCRKLSERGHRTVLLRDWNTIFDGLLEEYRAVIYENATVTLSRAA